MFYRLLLWFQKFQLFTKMVLIKMGDPPAFFLVMDLTVFLETHLSHLPFLVCSTETLFMPLLTFVEVVTAEEVGTTMENCSKKKILFLILLIVQNF